MNKPFHQAPFVERYLKMGDGAETAYEEETTLGLGMV